MADTVSDTPGPLAASPEQNSLAMETTMNDTVLEKSKDGCHNPVLADVCTDDAAPNSVVTNDLVNFDMGSASAGQMDTSLPIGMTDSTGDFDMLGSVDSQQADSMLYSSAPPGGSSSSLLVDLNTDSDIHDASTASLTSQSPATEHDPFDPLQQSAEKSYCSGVDLANEMSAEAATAGLVQPMIPDGKNDLNDVANNENFNSANQVGNHGDNDVDLDLHHESNEPTSVLPPAGTDGEGVQPSMDDEQNNSLSISETGDKDVEVLQPEPLMASATEEPTDHLPPGDVTRPEGQGEVSNGDREQLQEGTETDKGDGDDSKGNYVTGGVLPPREPLPKMLPMETGSEITGDEDRTQVKEDLSKPAEGTGETISETPEVPLHLMAVSRHIVSEVQENAFASLEQLDHPALKQDCPQLPLEAATPQLPLEVATPQLPLEAATEQVEQSSEPRGNDEIATVVKETPVVIDNEAAEEDKNATVAEKAEPNVNNETGSDIVKEKSSKNNSQVTETKKISSGTAKSPRNKSTPSDKKSQLVPPSSATKKTTAKKPTPSSLSSPRIRSAKKDGASDSGIEDDKGNHSRKSTAGSAATQTTPVTTPKHKSSATPRKPGGTTLTSAKANGGTTKPTSSRVTATPSIGRSPNMSAAKSRIGSLDNSRHTPGGGNVKIFSKKENFSTVSSRCGSKDNMKHHAAGGDKKIESKKLEWKVQSKVGSLDNAKHRPGGGTRKVESQKLEWKAASKVGSMDNATHKAGGGERRVESQKLEWKAASKVGSLDNATHKAGGGERRIESRKLDFKEKAQSKVGSKDNIQHKPEGGTRKIETQKLDFKEKAQSKVGSKDNIQHKPSGGDRKIETQKVDFASRAEARTDSGVANGTSPKADQ